MNNIMIDNGMFLLFWVAAISIYTRQYLAAGISVVGIILYVVLKKVMEKKDE